MVTGKVQININKQSVLSFENIALTDTALLRKALHFLRYARPLHQTSRGSLILLYPSETLYAPEICLFSSSPTGIGSWRTVKLWEKFPLLNLCFKRNSVGLRSALYLTERMIYFYEFACYHFYIYRRWEAGSTFIPFILLLLPYN